MSADVLVAMRLKKKDFSFFGDKWGYVMEEVSQLWKWK